jgi:iron(III) transport system permease protein
LKKRYIWWNGFVVVAMVLLLLVCTPVFTLLGHLATSASDQWDLVGPKILESYLKDTLILLVGVAISTFVLGTSAAWIVSSYDFPGRKYFEWLLILPMAFPSYMMAYSYIGLLEYTSPVHSYLRNSLGWKLQGPLIDLMNLPGGIFIFSISLFPYVYLFARTSFISSSKEVQEAASLLGSGPWRTFFAIALPMARPAIVGGIALASMEVLNDYGTVKYFGLNTFTTGIFRAWLTLGDLDSAIRLASILTLIVLLLLWAEYFQRGNKRWASKSGRTHPANRISLTGLPKWFVFAFCALIVGVAFAFPFGQLLYWVTLTAHKVLDFDFGAIVIKSFLLAASSSLLIVVLAILLIYSVRTSGLHWMKYVTRIGSLGYAIPGAVIAVGIMAPVIGFDKWLLATLQHSGPLLLSSGLFMLIFAYAVRFMAVGYNAIDGGFQKVGKDVNDAARTLGYTSWQTLTKVDLPIIRKSVSAGLLLVFVDVIKELPLTLILRPFNFHTLATKAFDMATNEQIAESANASLIVILTGILPIVLLNRIIRNND